MTTDWQSALEASSARETGAIEVPSFSFFFVGKPADGAALDICNGCYSGKGLTGEDPVSKL